MRTPEARKIAYYPGCMSLDCADRERMYALFASYFHYRQFRAIYS